MTTEIWQWYIWVGLNPREIEKAVEDGVVIGSLVTVGEGKSQALGTLFFSSSSSFFFIFCIFLFLLTNLSYLSASMFIYLFIILFYIIYLFSAPF